MLYLTKTDCVSSQVKSSDLTQEYCNWTTSNRLFRLYTTRYNVIARTHTTLTHILTTAHTSLHTHAHTHTPTHHVHRHTSSPPHTPSLAVHTHVSPKTPKPQRPPVSEKGVPR